MKFKECIICLLLVYSFVSCSKETNDALSQGSNDKVELKTEQFSSFLVEVTDPPISASKLALDFYNDPYSRYAVAARVDFTLNTDKTIDVFWEGNKTKERFLAKISLDTKALVKKMKLPTAVNFNSPISLGFESLEDNKYIVGYSKDNSFGNKNTEAWYTAFNGDTGEEIYSTRIWGEKNLDDVWSKGAPRSAGNAVLKYDKKNNAIAVYLSHTQKLDDGIRHQAGWIGFLNAKTGELFKDSKGKTIGDGWFYSHNFNQKCIVGEDGFYTIAHGDAYPRALGVSKWESTKGIIFNKEYYKIKNGKTGDNLTYTTTGDIIQLNNKNLAITFSTEDDRKKRDMKMVIVDGTTGDMIKENWMTEGITDNVGWGMKLARYGDDKIILGWNTFEEKIGTGSHFVVTDLSGNIVSNVYSVDNTELHASQSFKVTEDGENIIYVSVEGNNLKINTIEVK